MSSISEKITIIYKHSGIRGILSHSYKKLISYVNNVLVLFMSIFSINEKKIVLESQGDFSDNVRALYDYIINERPEAFELIWLVQNPKNYREKFRGHFVSRNEYKVNFKAAYHIATTRYFIFSHPYWLKKWRRKQIVIHTTHSVAQLKAGTNPKIKELYNYVLTCSPFCTDIRKLAFGDNNDDHFICIGQPRLDVLFRHKDCVSLLFPTHTNKRIVLCMETFKQTKTWEDSGESDKYAINVIDSEEELLSLDTYLSDNEMLMLVKIHHLQDMSRIIRGKYKSIVYLNDSLLSRYDIQINELLENADILLTDYSSVFYDYLLLDRPIGFLVKDIDDYKRGFIMKNPLEEMPGQKIYTAEELVEFLHNCKLNKDDYIEERHIIRDKVFLYKDANNSRRLVEWIERM